MRNYKTPQFLGFENKFERDKIKIPKFFMPICYNYADEIYFLIN